MRFRYVAVVVAVVVGSAAFCSPSLAAQPDAGSPSRMLVVGPGVRIGPITIGESLTALRERFPRVTLRAGGTGFELRVDGEIVAGNLVAGRVAALRSGGRGLAIAGKRLYGHPTSESQDLQQGGRKDSPCLNQQTLVYRHGPSPGRLTAITWTGNSAFVEIFSRWRRSTIPCTSSCPKVGDLTCVKRLEQLDAGAAKTSYTPVFRPFGQQPAGYVFTAAGDYTLTTNWQPGSGLTTSPPGTLTLTDQLTGKTSTSTISESCFVSLGPTRLLENCPAGPRTYKLAARSLPAGRRISLGTNITVGAIGRDWVQQGVDGSYINLETGQTTPNTSASNASHGRLYPDLDSPMVFHRACNPIRIASPFPGLISNVFFFGQRSIADVRGGLRLQQCGSEDQATIATDGPMSNGRIFVWLHRKHAESEIDGIDPSTGRRFVINLPQTLQAQKPLGVLINNAAVFVTTQVPHTGGLGTALSYDMAPLPAALRWP